MIVAGVLCGTSLDGIDVGIVEIAPLGEGLHIELHKFEIVPLAADLRARLLAAFPPQRVDALEISALHAAVGEAFGAAVARVAHGRRLDLTASHGITLAHDGAARHTLQIGDPFRIREATGTPVAFDFRAGDTAAGGQGAPLVPYLDAMLFAAPGETRVALNLGGIANLTVLRAHAAPGDAVAFDSGPANMPIDTYVRTRRLAADGFDRDGKLALAGRVDEALLTALLHDPYFALAPPKSTGRERFGESLLAQFGDALDVLAPDDAVATLTALCTRSVAAAVRSVAGDATVVIVSGGGARNPAILAGLRSELPGIRIATSNEFGIDPDAKEAILFAVLGCEIVRGRAANVPNVTGAAGPRLLGALAPHPGKGLP